MSELSAECSSCCEAEKKWRRFASHFSSLKENKLGDIVQMFIGKLYFI